MRSFCLCSMQKLDVAYEVLHPPALILRHIAESILLINAYDARVVAENDPQFSYV